MIYGAIAINIDQRIDSTTGQQKCYRPWKSSMVSKGQWKKVGDCLSHGRILRRRKRKWLPLIESCHPVSSVLRTSGASLELPRALHPLTHSSLPSTQERGGMLSFPGSPNPSLTFTWKARYCFSDLPRACQRTIRQDT